MTFLTEDMRDHFPELEAVYPDFEPAPVPIWLVTHRELHTNRRIRLAFDLLSDFLTEKLSASRPS